MGKVVIVPYADRMSRLARITTDPQVSHGQPVVRGLRYPVQMLLELLASGMTFDEIFADYPDLEREDLLAALEFGAPTAGGRRVDTPGPGEVPRRRTVAGPSGNLAQQTQSSGYSHLIASRRQSIDR